MRLLAIYNFCYEVNVLELAAWCVGRELGSSVSSRLELATLLLLDLQRFFLSFFLLSGLGCSGWGGGGAMRRLSGSATKSTVRRTFYALHRDFVLSSFWCSPVLALRYADAAACLW